MSSPLVPHWKVQQASAAFHRMLCLCHLLPMLSLLICTSYSRQCRYCSSWCMLQLGNKSMKVETRCH